MDIYKEHVIEALETEPLGFGRWAWIAPHPGVDTFTSIKNVQNSTDCQVCVVGALFRRFARPSYAQIWYKCNDAANDGHHQTCSVGRAAADDL